MKPDRYAKHVVGRLLGDVKSYREFPDFQPYWVDPDGEVWHAMPGGHIEWGRRKLGLDQDQSVMTEMRQRGWLRMVVRDGEVLIDTYTATPTQLRSVKDWTIEQHKMLFDEKTQRQVDL